jgi:hypothetical protein
VVPLPTCLQYRKQAKAKGIPFVDLDSAAPAELQLWLVPVFALYAGAASPKDVKTKVVRVARRGKRVVPQRSIKL